MVCLRQAIDSESNELALLEHAACFFDLPVAGRKRLAAVARTKPRRRFHRKGLAESMGRWRPTFEMESHRPTVPTPIFQDNQVYVTSG
jgi:hypothetical protein